MDNRPYMLRLDDYDEDTASGCLDCYRVLAEGMNDYNQRLLAVVNGVHTIDLPLVMTAMKMLYESLRANVPGAAAAVDDLLGMPFASVLTYKQRGGRE